MSQAEQMAAVYKRFTNNAKLRKRMTNLQSDSYAFYAFLSRFDRNADGALDNSEFNVASRILQRVKNIDDQSLSILTDIIKMLDFNSNACVDPTEQEKLFNLFDEYSSSVSDNDSLNHDELSNVLERLKAADTDGSGLVDKSERRKNEL